MLEQILECPICHSNDFMAYLEVKDHSITKEIFKLSKCKSCGFVFTNPRPDVKNIDRYYESTEYISHSNTNKGIINRMYQVVRSFSLKNKLSLVTKFSNSDKTILDIGCGTGSFLNICVKKGWKANGIEPNKNARNVAYKQFGLTVSDKIDGNGLTAESFQIITLWHVLEHVHLLSKRIEEISLLIKKNGKAIIAVPNIQSYDSQHYSSYWAAFDVPRHLYHFSAKNIKDLFLQAGFKFIESIPMKYDSFYVSILSEKYKQSSFPVLRGIYYGLKSNVIAGNNPEKYSSVIYVFEKK